MLALEERFMIREMYRKGISISELARRTGRDRKTIRQVVNAPELAPARQPRQAKACKIDPYVGYLEQRMAEGVLNARKLYGEILAQGYPGKRVRCANLYMSGAPKRNRLAQSALKRLLASKGKWTGDPSGSSRTMDAPIGSMPSS